jgi:hypothetical protein
VSPRPGPRITDLFAVVPDDLLERPDELRPWFLRSWEFARTLEPK